MLFGSSTTGFRGTDNPSSAHDPTGDGVQEVKRERSGSKTKAKDKTVRGRYSYPASYGCIVSESSRVSVANLLPATAAIIEEEAGDSSEGSDAEVWRKLDVRAGKMDLVHLSFEGLLAERSDGGAKTTGRHRRPIQLSRKLWPNPPLGANVTAVVKEPQSSFFSRLPRRTSGYW